MWRFCSSPERQMISKEKHQVVVSAMIKKKKKVRVM